MEERGYIAMQIKHQKKIQHADQTDFNEVIQLWADIEKLALPKGHSNNKTPTKIAYRIDEKNHIFGVSIAMALAFNATIEKIKEQATIDFLDATQQQAFLNFQQRTRQHNSAFKLYNSCNPKRPFVIDKHSDYQPCRTNFYESEFLIYGKIVQQGGIDPAFYIKTEEYGKLCVQASKEQVIAYAHALYQQWGIMVKGKRKLPSCEPYDLELVDFFGEYRPTLPHEQLDKIRQTAQQKIEEIEETDKMVANLKREYL